MIRGFINSYERCYDPASMKNDRKPNEHEQATIRAFVVRDKRERLLSFIDSNKNRRKVTAELPHFRWFDRRFATPVEWKVDPNLKLWARWVQGIANIAQLLRSRGAGQTCWVMSGDPNIDGQEMDLESALEAVVGTEMGAILSCVPGKLAYFEGEDESLLLEK